MAATTLTRAAFTSSLAGSVSFTSGLSSLKAAQRIGAQKVLSTSLIKTSQQKAYLKESVVCRVSAEFGQDVETEFAPAQVGTKLYVGNLPFNVDSQSLAELFQEVGVVELVEVVYDRDTGRSRGFGFVTMSTPEEAQAAIDQFDGSELGGRSLKVNVPTPKGERPQFDRNRAPRGGDTRGDRPRRGPSSGNKVFVGNLSWGMDDMSLEDLFAEFGKVLEAKVITDRETGRSRGFGFVTYATESEMNDAVNNLNGADVDGRPLRVNVAADKPDGR